MKEDKTIVVISQDAALSGILEHLLVDSFSVLVFRNIQSAIEYIYNSPPDLIILDSSPDDPYTMRIINNLKSDPIFYQLPVLMIISDIHQVPLKRDALVEDYLKKDNIEEEALTRVSLAVLRSERTVEVNPLTKLPGNISITRQVQARIEAGGLFALAYADLDHFKPFNDYYGFSRGDEVIRITGRLILNIVKSKEPQTSFVGHIGGDDFIFITSCETVEESAAEIIEAFDKIVPTLYDKKDRDTGFIETLDRQGNPRRYPVTALSIGIATNRNRTYSHFGEMTEVASEMKKLAKKSWGSCFLTDRRTVAEA